MYFAERVKGLNPSLTLALNAKAQELSAQQVRIYNFSVGEPNFPAPSAVVDEATRTLAGGIIRYSSAGGTLAFRQAIAEKYRRENQLTYEAANVVAGCGTKELLLHAFLSVLNADDEVLLIAPYWLSYREQVKIAGGKTVVIPYDEQSALPSVEQIERYATARTRAIVLNYPNNPSGRVANATELQKLGAYLAQKDWWIFSDEIYEYLVFSQAAHLSLLNVCPALQERTVIFNGLSKGFGMTGWRVGYALGNKQIVTHIRKLQSQSTTCLPYFVEKAATLAISHGKAIVQEQIDKIRHKCTTATNLLQEVPDLTFIPPEGAFYIFARLPTWLTKTKVSTALSFSEWLLHNYRVMVIPSEAFGVDNHIRISYATSPTELQKGVSLLAEGLKKLKQ